MNNVSVRAPAAIPAKRVFELPSVGGLASAAVFACLYTYPFPAMRLAVGGVELSYVILPLVGLAFLGIGKLLLGNTAMTMPRGLVVGTCCLAGSVAFSAFIANLSGRSIPGVLTIEVLIFTLVPMLMVLNLRRKVDIYLSFGTFYAVLLYLTAYGLKRFITEGRPWVEFHYEQATRNGDALFLAAAFCASLALLVRSMRSATSLPLTIALGLATAMTGVAVALSFARAAWFACIAGLLVVLLWRDPAAKSHGMRSLSTAMRLAVIMLFAAAVVVPRFVDVGAEQDLLQRFETIRPGAAYGSSNIERAELWTATVGAIPKWSWTGTGPGQFAYAIREAYLRLQHAHNMFLNTWIEFGLLGLIGLIAILLGLGPLFKGNRYLDTVRIALAAVIVGWLINGLFETPTTSVFFWAVIGLALATVSLGTDIANETEKRNARAAGGVA